VFSFGSNKHGQLGLFLCWLFEHPSLRPCSVHIRSAWIVHLDHDFSSCLSS
jgi:hypothetical protein